MEQALQRSRQCLFIHVATVSLVFSWP